MSQYGRDFNRRPGPGRHFYGDDFGFRSRERYLPLDRDRGDWVGWVSGPRPEWGPAFEGNAYSPSDRQRDAFALPPGAWETGQPWGGGGVVDQLRAGDLMTENPAAVTPDSSLADAAKTMRDLDVGIVPVVDSTESMRLQGVITDRDIAIRAAADGADMKSATVADFMTRQVETVSENDHVREVLSVMKGDRVRRVPVTDEEGRLVGIIAQADLAVHYAGLDRQRESEVEEVLERISEPARPDWRGEMRPPTWMDRMDREYDRDFSDRVRAGWRMLRREAGDLFHRGYDRDWR